MNFVCRILFLLVFSLYWGGLTFYTGIVVRIAHDVLNDPMDGGMITQRVTNVLQWMGVGMVALMIWNNVLVWRQHARLGGALSTCTLILACALTGLFIVHGQLDAVIDVETYEITDREAFTAGHRHYNQWTTLQWLSVIAYLPITLFAWSKIDRGTLKENAGRLEDEPDSPDVS